jgi:hypothetical protein
MSARGTLQRANGITALLVRGSEQDYSHRLSRSALDTNLERSARHKKIGPDELLEAASHARSGARAYFPSPSKRAHLLSFANSGATLVTAL